MPDSPPPPPPGFIPDPPPGFVRDSDPSGPSVMDPHPVQSAIKSVGKTIGRYDPTNPANMGRVAPLAAGIASAGLSAIAPEASIPAKIGLAALGGAMSPYAEYAASKAIGGSPEVPSWKDAARSAIMNGMLEGVASGSTGIGSGIRSDAAETAKLGKQVQPEMTALPEELRTPGNIRAAVKNRDFLKKLGMDDAQIDEALKDPSGTAEALQKSVDQGRKVADNFQQTIAGERARFHDRFDEGYGKQKTASAPVTDIAQSFQQVGQGAGQHELTPSFSSWLERKGKELQGIDLSQVPDPLAPRQAGVPQKMLDPNNPIHAKRIAEMQKQGVIPIAPNKPFSVEDMAALRTELHENIPANPTPLDRKAALALDSQITAKWEDTLRKAGASEEQIGRLKGTYQDWGNFQQTVKGLRPGSKDFGEQTADAFFKTAKQNPTLALNFAKMAEDSGTMPEFRESFMKQLTQEMRGSSGGPINQMEALRKLQTEWRGTDDGKAVLSAVFGKKSPMADPLEFSKVIGSANNPAAVASAKSSVSQFIRSPRLIVSLGTFYATYSLLMGSGASPWTDMRKDPSRAIMGLVGATLTLAGINKVMSHMEPATQRVFADWATNRDPEAFAKLVRMSGATATALASQPSEAASSPAK